MHCNVRYGLNLRNGIMRYTLYTVCHLVRTCGATILTVHVVLVFNFPVLFERDEFSKVLILKCENLLHNILFYLMMKNYSKLSFG